MERSRMLWNSRGKTRVQAGSIPSWIWNIDKLQLSDNYLQGSFSPASGRVRYLDLSKNELSGHLLADIHMHLSNAVGLILANNKFEGQIPSSIGNLRNLTFLSMSNNRLTGKVPATLSNLTLLRVLNLENNHLEREIPKELSSLSDLRSLRLGKNSFQGLIPSSLRNLSSLQVLDLGENSFLSGEIPQWIANLSGLHVLVMRSNNFGGILPSDIGRMPLLQVLDLSSNFFSGAIPHSYLSLPAMQKPSADGSSLHIDTGDDISLMDMMDFTYGTYRESMDLVIKGQELHYEYILSTFTSFDLSHNRLSGPLSLEIENLKGLIYLNLSMNSLSGPIPESLGNLVQLESVDLSLNNFSGRIRWQLGNLTYLAHLNLSYNNLYGRIPLQGPQMVTFDEWSYIGNPNLWGCPLQRNCSHPVATQSPPPAVGVEEERFEFPWYWACFGLSVGVGFAGVVVVFELKSRWKKKCFEKMDRTIEGMDRVILRLKAKSPWR